MKILLVDIDDQIEVILNVLTSISDKHEAFYCRNLDCGIKEYTENDIDIVIIDPTQIFGRKTLDYILKKNPKQKVITISDHLGHTEPKGCDYCQKNYNKVRLLKPIDTHELLGYLKEFHSEKCSFKNKFNSPDGLISIMDKITKDMPLCSYDKLNNIVKFDCMNSDYYNFLFLLKEKKVKFVIDENTVKLIESI